MEETQKEFLKALSGYGISFNALMAVGSVIQTEEAVSLMAGRIVDQVDNGAELNDGLVLRILVELMKEASE